MHMHAIYFHIYVKFEIAIIITSQGTYLNVKKTNMAVNGEPNSTDKILEEVHLHVT